ncbi:MAG: hypothetical protein ACF8LL_10470 [Phycisphaerales bacterium]
MIKTLRQWISRALALAVLGPLSAHVASGIVGIDGSAAHTLLTGDSAAGGIVALLIVGALTLVAGVTGTVLSDRREGFLAMGFVLGWVAWTSGRIGRIYLLAPDPSTSIKLAAEGALLTAFVVLTAVLMSRSDDSDPITSFSLSRVKKWLGQQAMLTSLGAALAAGAVIAWVFGSYDFPGQSTGVGFLAGIAAGVAGALAAGAVQGKSEHDGTPFAPMMLGVMLAGVLLPLLTIVYPGLGSIEELVLKGDLPGTMIVSPAAWLTGALLGVPMGHSWVEQTHAHANAQPASSGS